MLALFQFMVGALLFRIYIGIRCYLSKQSKKKRFVIKASYDLASEKLHTVNYNSAVKYVEATLYKFF